MPVLITGAHRPLARRVAAALLEEGGEVRVHSAGEVSSLRAGGAIVAAGDADDEGHLEASLAQVHTAIHVGRGVLAPSPRVLVTEAETLVRAATGAGVRRIVALSVVGASPGAPDPLRAAYGEVEALLAAAPVPTVVLRTSLVDTPAIRDALGTAGLSPDEREQQVAPVRPADVVELVVSFDRMRSSAASGHAAFTADGPTTSTLGDYLTRVGVARPGQGSLVGRRALDPARVPMLLPSLTGPWVSGPSDPPDAWAFTGVVPSVVGPGA
ncbi:SDR family oxidoreductase [Nitriliruptor alkaliphilus]|uniref:SDR family oxidoreductase n=1 Tax=Nitriliruptor alkaliphilus TaxID=427918 RepID=UPI0006963D8C|nr:NAD(P)H-binding protein [Nitriliruptor alkaliphilus]